MRKFYFIVLAFIFGIIAVSPALAQEGSEFSGSQLEIVSPKEGEMITGDEILLNIEFGSESGNHAHIWLDEPNPTADNLKSQEAPGLFLFRDIKPGDHIIIVELAGEDHKPIDPAQKITLKVKTRSAADVTQEEIAKALSQVKPAEKERMLNINTVPEETDKPLPGTWQYEFKKFLTSLNDFKIFLIIGAVIIFVVIAGVIYFLLRSKKQE